MVCNVSAILSVFHIRYLSGAIRITGGHFSNASVPVLIGRVQCVGNETTLQECSYETESHQEVADCDPSEVAGVTCQG